MTIILSTSAALAQKDLKRTLVVLAGGVVALGCAPGLLTKRLAAALRAVGL